MFGLFSCMHNTVSQPCHHSTEINEHYFVLDMGTQDTHGKTGHRKKEKERSLQPSKGEREVTY